MQIEGDQVVRPNPLQWLRYAYVGSVPAKNRAWVLYDATCRTWVFRHVARYFVLIVPIVAAVLLFLPAPMPLRVMSCLAAALPMALFYVAYTTDALDRRVEKAGYPPRTAADLRERRAVAAQRATVARYREKQLRRRGF